MTPYEVYFYSSGVVEDHWGPKDLGLNKVTAMIGYGLGGFLSFALMIAAAVLFLPRGISPEFLGTPALAAEHTLGQAGLLLALVGILFAVGGAAVETAFAGAYNLAQFFGWRWGKKERAADAPRFTLAWIAIFSLGLQTNAPSWVGISLVIGTSLLSLLIHLLYALAFSTQVMLRAYSRARRWIQGALGALFAFAGIKMLTSRA